MYLSFLILLLIFIAITYGLVHAYKKLGGIRFLLVFILIAGVAYVAFKIYERKFVLSVIPDALNVTSIKYRKEESWGFGPGGNEAGIRVYILPEKSSQQVMRLGANFLNNMLPNEDQGSRNLRGTYSDWAETPIKSDEHWQPNRETWRFDIYEYVCRYGFCIEIEPSVVNEANSIINSPGSYYAYGRIGLIIVSPSRKLVLYIYNG